MTKKLSPPESKPTSRTGSGKDEGKGDAASTDAIGASPMDRFKKIARKVVTASREDVEKAARRDKS